MRLIINIKTVLYFSDGYAFLGSYILEEVIKEIVPRGLRKAQRLILAGSRYAVLYFENKQLLQVLIVYDVLNATQQTKT